MGDSYVHQQSVHVLERAFSGVPLADVLYNITFASVLGKARERLRAEGLIDEVVDMQDGLFSQIPADETAEATAGTFCRR